MWAKRAGNTQNDFAIAIEADAAGNSYVTGQILGTVVIGSNTLVSAGGNDVFIAKYDINGNVIWAKRGGGANDDDVRKMTIDKAGNCYVLASFRSSTTFGTTTLYTYDPTDYATSDLVLAKYDANGNFVWARKVATGPYGQGGYGIKVDDTGNCYIAGSTISDATLGNVNNSSGNITVSTFGSLDIFVAKLDASGNALWAKSAGGFGVEYARDLAIDASGNTYITGAFESTINFGSGISLTSTGSDDIFFAKYDPNGNIQWAKRAGGAASDFGQSIELDPSGNIYMTGGVTGNVVIDGATLTSATTTDLDIFLAKFNPSGNRIWAQRAGGSGTEFGRKVVLDAAGNSFIGGQYGSTLANFGCSNISNRGSGDIYVAKYDPTGTILWAASAGGPNDDNATGISIDGIGNCYLAGYFKANASFGTTSVTSAGDNDIFVARLFSIPASISLMEISPICAGTSSQVSFTTSCATSASETFQVQLSDVNSSTFPAFPVVIGSGQSSPISITLPATTAAGNYKVRIVSLSGVISNLADLTVDSPVSSVSIDLVSGNASCAGNLLTFRASPTNGGSNPLYEWKVGGESQGNASSSATFTITPQITSQAYDLQVSVVMTASNACAGSATDTKIFNINPPKINLDNIAGPLCPGAPLSFSFDTECLAANLTYTLELSEPNSSIFPATPVSLASSSPSLLPASIATGNYKVRVVSSNGIVSNITDLAIAYTSSSVSVSVDEEDPCAGSVAIFTATPDNGGTHPLYEWKVDGVSQGNPAPNPEFKYTIPLSKQTFEVSVVMISSNACTLPVTATKEISINKFPGIHLAAIANPLCPDSPLTLHYSLQCMPNDGVTYIAQLSEENSSIFPADPVVLGSSTATSIAVESLLQIKPGNYKVRIVASSGEISNSVDLVINNAGTPTLLLQLLDSDPCASDSIRVKAVYSNAGINPLFQWKVNGISEGMGVPTTDSVLHIPIIAPQDKDSTLQISVDMLPALACTKAISAYIPVTIYPHPQLACEVPQVIEAKSAASFTASSTSGTAPYRWDWDFGNMETISQADKDTISYTYPAAGTFLLQVKVTDARGCEATCEKLITVQAPVNIPPNVFTPNGDKHNEKFTIDYQGNEKFEMVIYNRWGKPIATITDGIGGWDGAGCSTGVYFYQITVANRQLKGWVQLLR